MLHHTSSLLVLAIVILMGTACGAAARRIGLPAVTGQILGGLALGQAGLGLFAHSDLEGLAPLTTFALGLMAVTVGAHLNLRRLRNAGRRLFLLLLTEAIVTPMVVFGAVWGFMRGDPALAALLAATAVATAPATVVAVVKEERARGVFVKTLVAAVALNNMACIVLFEGVRAVGRAGLDPSAPLTAWLAGPVLQILPPIAVGASMAIAMDLVTRFVLSPERLATAAAATLVLTCGLATSLDMSPLAACLVLGLVQTNLTPARDKLVDSIFADFEPAILAVFFTLAGMELSFEHAGTAGLLTVVFVLARALGKLVSGRLSMQLAGATDRVRSNLGMALLPQAGVAVGLVILVQGDPVFSEIASLFTAVVLTAVTVNEIGGPICTRIALRRSGDRGKERVRLIDFIEEQHILTNFQASTKDEAIERLVDRLLQTHSLPNVSREEILASVRAREAEASTCLGGGLAVPHGILPRGTPMMGVMAISKEGLDFETPDGIPVHCMVLLGTSADERERHLEVLAMLARSVGAEPVFRDQLFNCSSPDRVAELLHGDESEDFNYYLEEPV